MMPSRILSKTLQFLALALAAPAYTQFLSLGVKAGVPITDGFQSGSDHAYQRPYVIGPTAGVKLPFHLSFEVDALYRRLGTGGGYTRYFDQPLPTLIEERAYVNDWQVPFLLKWQAGHGPLRPFVDAGVTYRHDSGQTLTQFYDASNVSAGSSSQTSAGVASYNNPNSIGGTVGAGFSAKLLLLRLSPELRYTHWASPPVIGNWNPAQASANQLDFLVGFTF